MQLKLLVECDLLVGQSAQQKLVQFWHEWKLAHSYDASISLFVWRI
jgi:hypothetical protein